MKRTLILYASTHHGNTRRLAETMAEAAGAEFCDLLHDPLPDLSGYDLIGMASGIYYGKLHPGFRNCSGSWNPVPDRGCYWPIPAASGTVPMRSRFWSCCGRRGSTVRAVMPAGAMIPSARSERSAALPGAVPARRNCAGAGSSCSASPAPKPVHKKKQDGCISRPVLAF